MGINIIKYIVGNSQMINLKYYFKKLEQMQNKSIKT